MSDAIIEFFSSLPGELYVFVISMLPIIELRGAIPVGAAIGLPFYTNYILAIIGNILPVPFILLFISKFLDFLERFKLTRPVVNWLRRKADKQSSKVIVESDSTGKPDSIEAPADDIAIVTGEGEAIDDTSVSVASESEEKNLDSSRKDKAAPRKMTPAIFAALLAFVAVPLPGTGAWCGSLIAALFNLPKRHSLLAISLGVLISGVVMCLASYGVVGFLSFFI